MTIDERIEKLTERHEALAETVQLLLSESRRNDEQIGKLTTAVHETNENITALLQIAASHQHRITAIEGGEQQDGSSQGQ